MGLLLLLLYYYYCSIWCLVLSALCVLLLLVANLCDAREMYQFFPNDLTLAIGIEHQFSSSTFLFFNFIYFMSSTKYSMHSLYLKNVEV